MTSPSPEPEAPSQPETPTQGSPFFHPKSTPSPSSPNQSSEPRTSGPEPSSPSQGWSTNPDMNASSGADGGSSSDTPSPEAKKTTGRPSVRELRKVTSAAVITVSGILAQVLTAEGSLERQAELWMVDGDDLDAIADPLATIAARRLPEGVADAETGDFVRLALGVVGYVMKNLGRRRHLRELAAGGILPADQTAQPETAPAGATL